MPSGADLDSFTAEHKQKSLRAVNLIKLKMSGELKGRMCANGAPRRKFVPRVEANFPLITI